ncbi:MAG: dihydrolipoyl dehydrogenase family protein [Candidatus Saccharimonadales bacterium]
MTKRYDLAIIGGGAGAFAAAIKANELGAKTALINDGLPLGGTCVNVGCVPSKALLHAAEVVHTARSHGIPGINFELTPLDFGKVVQDELNLVDSLRHEKYEQVLHNLSHVTHIRGRASFTSPRTVQVNGQTVEAEKFIIATGSTATVPPIDGLQKTGFLTHIEALKRKQLPKSLAIIGAGPLGLEFAQMYARFGCKVTILHKGPSIAPQAEPVLSQKLHDILSREGIDIQTNVEVQGVQTQSSSKIVRYLSAGQSSLLEVEEILIAAGKTANTWQLDLDKAGVAIDEHQAVVTKPNLQTSQTNIYAVGDVTDLPKRLETTAGHEGTLAAENALSSTGQYINYDYVPYTIFTDPQLASVGLTEAEQMSRSGVCALPYRIVCATTPGHHQPPHRRAH